MSDELRFRLGQVRRRRELLSYLPKLERALGIPVVETDFLDPRIDELYGRQYFDILMYKFQTYPRSLHQVRDAEFVSEIWDTVASIVPSVQDLEVVFLIHPFRSPSAIMVSADVVLRSAARIMSELNDDINLFTIDLSSGLNLEFNHYHDQVAKYEYELRAWGKFVPISP